MEKEQAAYKDLQVWQRSMDLADRIIQMISTLDTPRNHFRLIEQLESAVTSIPMNIAEGKGKETKKDFIHYLYIARGSAYETLTLLEIFSRQGWISSIIFSDLEALTLEVIRMLKGLINSLS
jgi:four helix bundle protein